MFLKPTSIYHICVLCIIILLYLFIITVTFSVGKWFEEFLLNFGWAAAMLSSKQRQILVKGVVVVVVSGRQPAPHRSEVVKTP